MRDIAALAAMVAGSDHDCIVPIPRGGWPVATALSVLAGIPIVSRHERPRKPLYVDDLVDSGRTIERLGVSRDHVAVLYRKPHSPQVARYYVDTLDGWLVFPWEQNEAPAEDAVVRLLEAIGEDPRRPGLVETPRRVITALREMTSSEPFGFTTFDADGMDEMITVGGITFSALCEHHILPFTGKAAVAYIPDKQIVGLSKLARLVRRVAHEGLQTQERITSIVADELETLLAPRGVGVLISASHSCMSIRGVVAPGTVTITSALRGFMLSDAKARSEFMTVASTAAGEATAGH